MNHECTSASNVFITVLPSFSIKTPSWLRNLLPMLMNANLPNCWTETSPSNIFLTRGFLLSVIIAASDVCSASLFFSINCAYRYQPHISSAFIICRIICLRLNKLLAIYISFWIYYHNTIRNHTGMSFHHQNQHDNGSSPYSQSSRIF